jgi:hypothetical protein
MQLVSIWSDLYGSTLALYVGRAGGHRWLVATAPEHASAATAALEALEGKGEAVLLVYSGPTPLDAALQEQINPVLGRPLAGVLVVDRGLAGGPASSVAVSTQQAGGMQYREGGRFPAWQDALGGAGEQGECPAAGVCASLGLPVRVCAPQHIGATLLEWWATVPHALVASD